MTADQRIAEIEAIEAAEIIASIHDFLNPHISRQTHAYAGKEFYDKLVQLIDKRIALRAEMPSPADGQATSKR